MGRKNLYDTLVEPYLDEVKKMAGTLSEGQIARRLGITADTFVRYKKQHPELVAALIDGRRELVESLKEALKKKGLGFPYTEKKTTVREADGVLTKTIENFERYSPPDTGAIHLLLKNLDPEWRNDDRETMDLKAKKLELERQKAEAEDW